MSKVNLENLVAIKAVTNSCTLEETYGCAMQIQAADKALKARIGSVYGRLRFEVIQLVNKQLQLLDGDRTKLDYKVVGAQFITELEAAEKAMDANATKRPAVWVQAKSQLKAGLEEGVDFIENPEIGQSALRDATKELREAREDAERKATIEAYNKEHGIVEAPKAPAADAPAAEAPKAEAAEAPKAPAAEAPAAEAPKAPAAEAPKAPATAPVVAGLGDVVATYFKDAELAKQATALIETLSSLEAMEGKNKKGRTGHECAERILENTLPSAEQAANAFKAAIAALAKAS